MISARRETRQLDTPASSGCRKGTGCWGLVRSRDKEGNPLALQRECIPVHKLLAALASTRRDQRVCGRHSLVLRSDHEEENDEKEG